MDDNKTYPLQNDTASAGSGRDAGEFGRLYEQYLTGVYQYVLYRVGERTTAEDLTSDIFNKALSNFPRYNPEKASFASWIFSIARNTVIDYYRKHARESKLRNDTVPDVPSRTNTPEEEAALSENADKLRESLLKLNQNEQELISLKFSSSMTNREIARISGLSESNVGTMLSRAIRKLRDEFAGW